MTAETIERRYLRGLRNFFDLYLPLADAWTLCDNSGNELAIVAQACKGGEIEVRDVIKYATIKRQAGRA